MRYAIHDKRGRVGESGEGELAIDGRAVTLQPRSGTPLVVPHGDIDRLEAVDYRLDLRIHTGETVRLSHLGAVYEQVLARLATRREEVLRRDLLMEREPPREAFPASVQASAWGEAPPQPARVLVYRDQVAVISNAADPLLLPFAELAAFRAEPGSYVAALEDEDGGRILVGKLGARFEEFASTVRRVVDDLDRRTGEALGALVPGLDPMAMRRLVRLCRDGRAVKEAEAAAAGADVWGRLERAAIAGPGLRESFETLRSLGRAGQVWIGIRPGAGAAEDADTPAESAAGDGAAPEAAVPAGKEPPDRPAVRCGYFVQVGGAVAHEVVSEGDHATYLYRLGPDADRDVRSINRALRFLQFRREPVTAPPEEIEGGRLSRFRLALRKHASLRQARAAFLGRALHASAEAWRKAVDAALAKAVAAGGVTPPSAS